MDNLYQYLIGEPPTDKQSQAAIAAQLRRRRSFGELGALTGDRVLQSFGQNLGQSADEYAGALQSNRQKDVDDRQRDKYQSAQIDHMKELERLQERGQTLDHIYKMLMAQAALGRADKTVTRPPARLTYSDRNKLEEMAGLVNNSGDLLTNFKPEYTQKFGPGPQSKLSNTMSSLGLGTEEMDKASNWWANWNLIYTLPQRNATFGATLTPTERQAWTESDINPSMGEKQIKERVSKVVDILKKKGALMNKTYSAQFDPELVAEYGLPGEEFLAPQAATAAPAAPAGPVQKRVKVDWSGNPIGTRTP